MNLYKLKKESANWNPMDWFKKPEDPEKKEDLEVIQGMKNIQLDLSEVSKINENVKTEISRLKMQSVGYINNAFKNLGNVNVDKNVINKFIEQIDLLDGEDWSKSLLAIQQLIYLTRKSNIQNSFVLNYLDDLTDNINKIYDSFNKIYSKLNDIQNSVSVLSNKKAILGRENQYTSEGEKNYLAIHSPYEEFADLKIALQKLYNNPFDYRGLEYTQRLLSRLWDKLRYIERPMPDHIKEWIGKQYDNKQGVPVSVGGNQKQNPTTPTPSTSSSTNTPANQQSATQPSPSSVSPQNPASTTNSTNQPTQSNIDVDKILQGKTKQEVGELLQNLTQMIVNLGNTPAADQLKELYNNIKSHIAYSDDQSAPTSSNKEDTSNINTDQYQQYKEDELEEVPAEHIDEYARKHRTDLIPLTTQLVDLKKETGKDENKIDQYLEFKEELLKENFTPEDIRALLEEQQKRKNKDRVKRRIMSPIRHANVLRLNKIASFFDQIGLEEVANVVDTQIKTIILKEKKEI